MAARLPSIPATGSPTLAIPRIIHQTARNLDSLPEEIRQNIEALKALNPGWEHRFYSDEAVREYIG